MRNTSLHSLARILLVTAVLVGIAPAQASAAYDYAAACAYADRWSSNTSKPRNPAYDRGITNDCCNFVSQCLHDATAGKKSYDTAGSTEAFQWWTRKTLFGWDSTMSWVNCSYSYNYMMENPAGTYIASWDWNPATVYPTPPNYTSQFHRGDIVYYDWTGNGSKDHVGIRVSIGTDVVSGWSGDLANLHSNDRRRAIWHLRPYNADYRTTRITLVRPM